MLDSKHQSLLMADNTGVLWTSRNDQIPKFTLFFICGWFNLIGTSLGQM